MKPRHKGKGLLPVKKAWQQKQGGDMQIFVKGPSMHTIAVQVDRTYTLDDVKEAIAAKIPAGLEDYYLESQGTNWTTVACR